MSGRALAEAHRLVVLGLEHGAVVRLPRKDIAALSTLTPVDVHIGGVG